MLGCWVDGTKDSSIKGLMLQAIFFFIIFYITGASIKGGGGAGGRLLPRFWPNSRCRWAATAHCITTKNFARNHTWNIRRLVDDSFVPSSKQPSVSYSKLADFNIEDCQIYSSPSDIENESF